MRRTDGDALAAGIYTRISSDPEGLELGVERQREDLDAFAAQIGLTVVDHYVDNDRSASTRSTKSRPEYDRLLEDARAGRIRVILAYSSSRLTRRIRENEDLIELAERHGVTFRYLRSPSFDLNSADGRNVARILAANDAAEAERIAERVSRAAVQRAEQGGWHGGHAPFGYLMHGGALAPHPEHAAWLLEAVDRVLAGETAYSVCSDWNRNKKRRTPQGSPWTTRTLIRALTNPALVAQRTHKGEVVGPGRWPALVSEETFAQLRTVVDTRAESRAFDRTPHATARKYPFTGLVVCSNCGNGMYRQVWKGKKDRPVNVDTYVCARPTRKGQQADECGMRINAGPVDELITAAIMAAFDSPAVRARLAAPPEQNEKVATLRRALLDDERRLQQIDDDHYDGVLERAAWLRQRARVEDRITETRKELDRLAARSVISTADLTDLPATWATRTPDWQHTVARMVFEKVEILPHPRGVATRLTPRKTEDPANYQQRADDHRREVLRARVRLIRRA